jgi:hypothetical protein
MQCTNGALRDAAVALSTALHEHSGAVELRDAPQLIIVDQS